LQKGPQMDGTYRMHWNGQDMSQFCKLGTFSEKAVLHEDSVVKIRDHIPFETACLCGCGVATGFGAAANRADINAGDTAVVFGFGGVGANAVQGARISGADDIIVVEPKDQRREWSTDFGATRTVDPDEEDIAEVVDDITWGRGADAVMLTADVVDPTMIGEALGLLGARGEVVMVGVSPGEYDHIDMAGYGTGSMLGMEKELKGTVYGGWGPQYAVPHLLKLWENGTLQLDELRTKTYDLEDVNQAFDDMLNGRVIRGVVTP
ncbi:MAG: zinc-binding dehydrogenase, partial [Halobacteriales archaeon]